MIMKSRKLPLKKWQFFGKFIVYYSNLWYTISNNDSDKSR